MKLKNIKDIETTKKHSTINRVLHGAIALTLTLIIGTIFLRMTWLDKNNVADIIQGYLSTTDQSLSRDQAVVLAKQIRQPMWDWHWYLGYFLTGLLAIRFSLSLFGKMEFPHPFRKHLPLSKKFQAWVYFIFYICVSISLITGLILEFGSGDFIKPIKVVHKLSLYYLIPFIVIHLGGVLAAWYKKEREGGLSPTL